MENNKDEAVKDNEVSEVLDYSVHVTDELNKWKLRLVQRYFEYDEIVNLFKKNSGMSINTTQGQMPVFEVVEIRYSNLREALQFVKSLTELKAIVEKGDEKFVEKVQETVDVEPKFEDLKKGK